MDAVVQSKINELAIAAVAADARPDEIAPALRRALHDAVIAQEAAKPCPLPDLPSADVGKIIAFLTDGGGVPDLQKIYQRLRTAIVNRDQPAFWKSLFLLVKAVKKTYPFWDQI